MYNQLRMIMNSGSILGYFFQAVPITCIVGVVYIGIRIAYIKHQKRSIVWLDELMKLLFACYLTGLLSLVVLPANFWLDFFDGLFFGWWEEMGPVFSYGGFNLVPSIIKVFGGELILGSWVKTMLLGNIAMFLPFGFFIPFVTKKVNRKNVFILAVIVPITVELLQLILGRSFDIDDLICNFIGIVVGYFVALTLKGIGKKYRRKRVNSNLEL